MGDGGGGDGADPRGVPLVIPTMGGGRSPNGLGQRASGLYVPSGAVEKTLPAEDFQRMRRAMRMTKRHGIHLVPACPECKGFIALERHDRLVQGVRGKAGGGRFRARCSCTVWTVR